MSYMEFGSQVKEVFYGNLLLIACCLFYLGWWIVAFSPNGHAGVLLTRGLLSAAAILGITGLVSVLAGINGISGAKTIVPSGYLLWGGIIAYLVLAVVTSFLMKRQITTELLLILGWAILELSALNELYGLRRIALRPTIILAVIICIAAVISLVCYIRYYRLDKWAGYIDGMIPLITEILTMAGITGVMLA